jgi:HPt (histidine-containing phosphotransfer) domain-containing protein
MDDLLTKPILSRDLDDLLHRVASKLADMEGRVATPGNPVSANLHAVAVSDGADGRITREDSLKESDPWLDQTHIREMNDWVQIHDRGFWERASDQFRLDLARLLKTLREALASDRLVDAAEAAHSLKGVSLMLGFRRLGGLSREMEDLIRVGGSERWDAKLAEIEAGLEPTLARLDSLLEELRPPGYARSSVSRT